MSFLFFFILVNPFCPINLNILIFSSAFSESWPKWFCCIFLMQNNQEMETGFSPFRLLRINSIKKFKIEWIFLVITDSMKCNSSFSEIDFLLLNIPKANFNEDSIFSLSPLENWMTILKKDLQHCVWIVK